jgi:hypothetical protein
MRALVFLLVIIISASAQAYPNFIGYGYDACMTCHYNGQGGGALNDYGRALFATEITSRQFYADTVDEEEIGNRAGFLGKTPIPWWIRPGIKYRGLWFQNNPGSKAKFDKFYNMQSDVNLNFFFDQKQEFSLITTAAYTTYPRSFSTSREDETPYWFAKEYYIRWQSPVKNLWFYLGQMDKVFGIRQADHTAVNRSPIGLGQFDQSQGVIIDYQPAKWSSTVNLFAGNGGEKSEVRQKGFTLSGEYEVYDRFRAGASALHSKSESIEWTRLAAFTRMGLSKGSSLMSELGLFSNKSLLAGAADPTTGAYALIESWLSVRRGYNVLSTIEYAKGDLKTASSEKMRWSLGGILFPYPRSEVRAMLINSKTTTPDIGVPDNWQVQMQVHFSL